MPSLKLSAETHIENHEETSDEKPLPHRRKSSGVRHLAWSLKCSGKRNSENMAKTLWGLKNSMLSYQLSEKTDVPWRKGRNQRELKYTQIYFAPLPLQKSSHFLQYKLTFSYSLWKLKYCIFSYSSENFATVELLWCTRWCHPVPFQKDSQGSCPLSVPLGTAPTSNDWSKQS